MTVQSILIMTGGAEVLLVPFNQTSEKKTEDATLSASFCKCAIYRINPEGTV